MIVLSDNDVRGAVSALHHILKSSDWADLAGALDIRFAELEDVGLAQDSTDFVIWSLCQTLDAVLITGNRSAADGIHSLDYIIRIYGNRSSIPVMTIADPNRVVRDRNYAIGCAFCLLDYLERIDELRGIGRIYLSPP